MSNICYKRHRFQPEVIRHAVWHYARFTESYRDVEYLVAEQELDISYKTVRRWFLEFGAPTSRILSLTAEHIDNKRANNRAENSHRPVRRRERKQQRFKSPVSAQRLLNIQSAVYNTFYIQRHLLNRPTFKRIRTDAFNVRESAGAGA